MDNSIKRFITCYIPVHACNFRCNYCYLSHHYNQNVYGGGIKPFALPYGKIAKFFSVERMGGYCYFNLCAPGETLMHPDLIGLVSELTKEGHYSDIITNGTLSNRFDEIICALDDAQKKHLFIKFSFHYLELKRRNKMSDFLNNISKIKDAGISYSIEITPHDELIPYIDDIKDFSMQQFGALPHVTVARNEGTKEIALLSSYNKSDYKKIWSVFDSPLFDFKLSIFSVKRKEFCYAGLWSLTVNLETGIYRQCYGGDVLGNIKNTDGSINFRPIGKCRLPHCFNGHAFLACGNIPELETPTYAAERNRTTNKGENWFRDEANAFFSTHLYETNDIYNEKQKRKQNIVNSIYYILELGRKCCSRVNAFWSRS